MPSLRHAHVPWSAGRATALILAVSGIALPGCGGGNDDQAADQAQVDGQAAVGVTDLRVQPTYHLAPVLPGDPGDVDRDGRSASASMAPREVGIPATSQRLSTRALTYRDLESAAARARSASGASVSAQLAASAVTYTPAQIRAAYGLPPVPSNLSNLTALQAAQLGAGQTLYVVDAFHDPYAYGELLAFSNLFGLPSCTRRTLDSNASLPLSAPDATSTACDFYQVSATPAGSVASAMPRYDAQWAIEIAMDIQWAHAIAPLARIVLIEAELDSMAAITGAIQLGNQMGPGVMSMSFATPEGGWVSDSLFQAQGMSYFAATGDSGTAVNWPAVSPSVVAVGGTSLRYRGTGVRSESAWSLTGGGVSSYVARPGYQDTALLRTPSITQRSVADVAMNADPSTGQFVAVIPNPLTCTFCQVSWVTAGGTSLATPQWAALAAVANAMRAQAGKASLGAPHAALYQSQSTPGAYAGAFLDVAQGSNGRCTTCTARTGYDGPTGLGTPKGLGVVNLLAESSVAPIAPTVVGFTVNGAYGTAISFTPSVSSMNAYALSISGGPRGMVLVNGVVSWPSPIAGTFTVNVTARDLKSNRTGSGVYTVVVRPPPPPIVGDGSLTATAGRTFAVVVGAGDRYPCRLTLVGAPAGMTISARGFNAATIAWANPRVGTYRFTLRADSTQTGLSAQGSYTVVVNPASAPQVATGQVAGSADAPFAATVDVVSANPYTLSLVDAPAGLMIDAAGTLSWPSPTAGSYGVTVQARDNTTGLVGSGVINLKIGGGTGPAIFSSVMSGVAGRPFTGSISITDVGAGLVGVSFAGSHPGIKFSTALGMATTAVSWAAPIAGNYTVQVSVTDSAGKSTFASIPLVVTAR